MTLTEYLSQYSVTQAEIARRTGLSIASVSRVCNGKQRPSWHMIAAIRAATDGAVQPNDFFEAPASTEAA